LMNQQHVLHRFLLLGMVSYKTNGQRRNRQLRAKRWRREVVGTEEWAPTEEDRDEEADLLDDVIASYSRRP
jgi:hypothetical protein